MSASVSSWFPNTRKLMLFLLFSSVWKPRWNTRTRFWNITKTTRQRLVVLNPIKHSCSFFLHKPYKLVSYCLNAPTWREVCQVRGDIQFWGLRDLTPYFARQHALIGLLLWERNGWFIEMVHADMCNDVGSFISLGKIKWRTKMRRRLKLFTSKILINTTRLHNKVKYKAQQKVPN